MSAERGPYAAVLFDLDGTLLSSTAAVERSWDRLAVEYAIPAERFFAYHGMTARAILERLLPDRSADERETAHERIVELESSDTEGVEALPGAAEALAALVPTGRCAIVTSGSRVLARARLAAAGVDVPAVVITADDVEHGKPDPEPYLTAARALGVAAADCLVVEDAAAGLASGRASGATTLGLRTTLGAGIVEADLVVDDLSAVRLEPAVGGVLLLRR
ncbi:HAD-IA family hydrolase [Actinotalea sp.]|uniref:HAD-IA family hydrolase n=1 Tax=Actinotalea sp. TaxID=1872145 RepID=UPI003567CFE7